MNMKLAGVILAATLSVASSGFSQVLDVSFDTNSRCGDSRVVGLDPNGDGFLAVRSGPGANYRKLDQIYNGDNVRIFAEQWPWVGIVYGSIPNWGSGQCGFPPGTSRGWVHTNWLDIG